MRRAWICLALVLSWAPASAQPVPAAERRGSSRSRHSFRRSKRRSRRWIASAGSICSPRPPTATRCIAFYDSIVPEGVTRAVVKERDRVPLAGTLPGEGFRLTAEAFIETGPRGRIGTWTLDIRKPRGDRRNVNPGGSWRSKSCRRSRGCTDWCSTPTSSSRRRTWSCAPSTSRCACPPATCSSPRHPTASRRWCFSARAASTSRRSRRKNAGRSASSPAPRRSTPPFTAAFVRVNPFEFSQAPTDSMLKPLGAVDQRAFRRAQQVFDEEIRNSFSLDLSDLSRDTWSLLPQLGDFVAEVRTRRHGKLTFARCVVRTGRRVVVPARAQAQHLALRVGAEAGGAGPVLRRGHAGRVRRARLHRGRGLRAGP